MGAVPVPVIIGIVLDCLNSPEFEFLVAALAQPAFASVNQERSFIMVPPESHICTVSHAALYTLMYRIHRNTGAC